LHVCSAKFQIPGFKNSSGFDEHFKFNYLALIPNFKKILEEQEKLATEMASKTKVSS
jgi:hypothetical protein